MAKAYRMQTTMAGGIHSPNLRNRVDLNQYYTGVKKADNVLLDSKGVATRRWGTKLVSDLPAEPLHMIDFSVTDKIKIVLIILKNKGLYVLNPNKLGELNAYGYLEGLEYKYYPDFFSDYTQEQLEDVYYTQSLNTLILTQGDVSPKFIATENIDNITDAINNFVIKNINIVNNPQFNFEDEYSPIGEPFRVLFSVARSGVGPVEFDELFNLNTHFRFSLNGNISNYIDRIYNERDNNQEYQSEFIRLHFNNNFNIGNDFELTIIERNSGYKFKHNKRVITGNTLPTDLTSPQPEFKNIESEFLGEEKLKFTGSTESEFADYLSVELTKMFFKETHDFNMNETLLYNYLSTNNKLPVTARHISGTFGNDLIMQVNFNNAVTIEEYGVTHNQPNLPQGTLDFFFCAWGCYAFESDVINKVRIYTAASTETAQFNNHSGDSFETYADNNLGDDNLYIQIVNRNISSLKIENNFSPYGIFFKVKREIEKMGVVKNMKNVFVNNGIKGIFCPFGGCDYDPNGLFTKLNTLPSGYKIHGFDYSFNTTFHRDFVDYILGIDRTVGITGESNWSGNENVIAPLQDYEWGQLAEDNKVLAKLFTIGIEIKGIDAEQYLFELDIIDDRSLFGKVEDLKNSDLPTYGIKQGGSRLEDAWSQRRGYPKKCAFIENRLVFANTKLIPDGIWFSNDGDFFNFRTGGNKTDGFFIRPIQTTLNQVNHIVGSKSLQVFTSGSEHYNPNALTQDEIALPQQSNYGAREDLKPVNIDGSTFFLDEQNNLRSFIYDDLEVSYKSINTSILTDKVLLGGVKKMKPVRYQDSNYIFLIKGSGITVFQTIRDEQVNNYTYWYNSNLNFEDVLNIDNKVFTIVKVNNEYKLALFDEKLNLDLCSSGYTHPYIGSTGIPTRVYDDYDNGKKVTISSIKQDLFAYIDIPLSETSISEQTELNGEWIPPVGTIGGGSSFFLNYYNLENYGFENSDGYIIGYHFDSLIETKDIAYDIGQGQEITGRKKFTECVLSLYNTTGWNIEIKGFTYKYDGYIGENFRMQKLDDDIEFRLTGYNDRVNIKIKQEYPVSGGSLQAITLKILV